MKIKIAIAGYGNLGKGVECAIKQNNDMELYGIFSRREPSSLQTLTGAKTYHIDDILNHKENIDVVILCGGSATDLPKQTPFLAEHFCVVDSFDTHAKIPEHFENVNHAALKGKNTALISAGWDPGMFSLNRLFGEAILPDGYDYTFWGKGISQGHSDAIRRIDGVIDARQYTIPVDEALQRVRSGENPTLTTRQKHIRECFVVAEAGADLTRIENEIKTMPNYFADYDTTVHFISAEELKQNHSGIPHGGIVIRSGKTGLTLENSHIIEYKLTLDSNPEFTSSVLVAYARAVFKMHKNGDIGCKTVLDVAPSLLSPDTAENLRKRLL